MASVGFDERGFVFYRDRVKPDSYETIKEAFVSKYGPPCEAVSGQIQNGFGATFSQAISVWCFSDGKLSLSKYDPAALDFGYFSFTGTEYLSVKADRPVVNF